MSQRALFCHHCGTFHFLEVAAVEGLQVVDRQDRVPARVTIASGAATPEAGDVFVQAAARYRRPRPEPVAYLVLCFFFGLSGSDANETQVKLVWYYNNAIGRPQKKKIISRWRGYHGSGLMTGSIIDFDQSVMGCYESAPHPSKPAQ